MRRAMSGKSLFCNRTKNSMAFVFECHHHRLFLTFGVEKMKTFVFGLCIFGYTTLSGAVQAQCGCGSTQYAPMRQSAPMSYSVPRSYAAPMSYSSPKSYSTPMKSYSAPMSYSSPMAQPASMASGTILFVNELIAPVDRGTYSLLYAVHLSNGRLLYTDSLPAGFNVRGTEAYRTGQRATVNVGADGRLNVNDPVSNQVIAILPQ